MKIQYVCVVRVCALNANRGRKCVNLCTYLCDCTFYYIEVEIVITQYWNKQKTTYRERERWHRKLLHLQYVLFHLCFIGRTNNKAHTNTTNYNVHEVYHTNHVYKYTHNQSIVSIENCFNQISNGTKTIKIVWNDFISKWVWLLACLLVHCRSHVFLFFRCRCWFFCLSCGICWFIFISCFQSTAMWLKFVGGKFNRAANVGKLHLQ